MSFRILVTGWRDWPSYLDDFVTTVLGMTIAQVIGDSRPVTVVHGACPYGGVDFIADQHVVAAAPYHLANGRQLTAEPHPAEVTSGGRILGPARNTRMVERGAHLCLAFPGPGPSRGTVDCYSKAIRAGIPTRVYPVRHAEQWSAAGEPIDFF